MDHNCDSFYNSQQRISRFPGLVYTGTEGVENELGLVYEVFMTGTPPKRMRWALHTPNDKSGFTVKIAYPSALSRSVKYQGGEIIPYNKWLKKSDTVAEAGYGPILQEFCGENRYIGVKNILEFYINGECELEIEPRDAI